MESCPWLYYAITIQSMGMLCLVVGTLMGNISWEISSPNPWRKYGMGLNSKYLDICFQRGRAHFRFVASAQGKGLRG